MSPAPQPRIHGATHVPGGADPIPGWPNPAVGEDVAGKILATGPDAFWRLDELTGTVAHDSSGNGHDMNPPVTYSPPLWNDLVGPTAMPSAKWPAYAGGGTWSTTSEHVTMPVGFTDDFTAGVWVYQLVDHGAVVLFGQGTTIRGTGALAGLGWTIAITPGTAFTAYGGASTVGAVTYLTGTTAPATGTWYFVALVRDTGTWKLYVNGVLETSAASSHFAGSTDTWLGTDEPTVGLTAEDTLLSAAFITNTPLTSTVLLDIYNTGVYGSTVLADKVWTALGDGTAAWKPVRIEVEY